MPTVIFRATVASTISFIVGAIITTLTLPSEVHTSLLVGTCSSLFAANHVAAQHGHLLLLDPAVAVWRWARRACFEG